MSLSKPSPRKGDKRVKVQPLCMWTKEYLDNHKNGNWIAPVSFFKHVPFSSVWDKFATPNLVIELPNPLVAPNSKHPVNWIGKIHGYAGYKALVVFLASSDSAETKPVCTWIPFCSSIPKPLGFSFTQNILLHPPTENAIMEPDQLAEEVDKVYQAVLFKEAKPVETVKFDHQEVVQKELDRCSSRFSLGELVEALDKTDCSRFRVAEVVSIVGDRMVVRYVDDDHNDKGFWFGQQSPHIHKLGWCSMVGAPLGNVDASNVIFPKTPPLGGLDMPELPPEIELEPQMIFEMIHPVLNHKFCAGYVVKVLKHGYFVAGTDWTRGDELVEIVLHATSDYIVPLGFCRKNRIPFEAPKDAFNTGKGAAGESNPSDFSWKRYCIRGGLKAYDPTPIPKKPHKFTKGCKLEAASLSSPVILRPATVTQVADRLIKIHFDGEDRMNESSFEWVSCDSCNIYPAGYSEMVWHSHAGRPEAPRILDHVQATGAK